MPINRILQFRGEGFYKLVNGDGKVWLMPARNMRIAMNLYQPSGIKGKLLKHFFRCSTISGLSARSQVQKRLLVRLTANCIIFSANCSAMEIWNFRCFAERLVYIRR